MSTMRPSDVGDDRTHRDQKGLVDAAWQQVEQARSGSRQASGSSAMRWPSASPVTGPSLPSADWVPGYRIVREIHRGGQGVVYEAVQASTNRTVAVKVMRGGPFAGPREKARFEREVQILAQLKHPNIVTVHDSGTAGDAVYFVMDYVAGEPFDRYVERSMTDLRSRLELFSKVCAAVHVAHLRGVIHRDLKPGNIRVDAAGEPHILDFGLAKHSEWDTTPEPGSDAVTLAGQFVGSLPWASPEQAEGRLDELDVRTDVYSLGVMFYRLLTGTFPYDVSGSLRQTAHNIVNCEPPNPRTANTRVDDELATIALKSLRKEREYRYQSAGDLGRDIERYLLGEPIEAKRDSFSYVFRKQLARHRVTATVITAFVVILTAGFFTSLTFWRQAIVARDAEREHRETAERNASLAAASAATAEAERTKSARMNRFLIDMLKAASPLEGGRADVTVRETLDAASRQLEQDALADQPEVEAAVRHALGGTYGALGLLDPSARHLDAARMLVRPTDDSSSETYLSYTADLAEVRRALGEVDAAEGLFRETLEKSRKLLGPDHLVTLQCVAGLASILRDRGRFEDSEKLSREILSTLRAARPDDDTAIAAALHDLSLSLTSLARTQEALEVEQEALELYRQHHGDVHPTTAAAMDSLAGTYVKLGRFDEAEQMYLDAQNLFRRIYGEKHPSLASTMGSLGNMYRTIKRLDEAERLLRESFEMRRELLGDEHPLVATSINNLALVQYERGNLDAAADSFRESLVLLKRAYGDNHPSRFSVMNNLAAILRLKGDYDAATAIMREIVTGRTAHFGPEHPEVATSINNLGKTLLDAGQVDEAETLLRQALEMRRKIYPDGHAELATTLENLGGLLRKTSRLDEAETVFRESLEYRRKNFGEDNLSVSQSLNNLAGVFSDRGDYETAEQMWSQAIHIMEEKLSPEHWETALVRANWAGCLIELKQFEKAEPLLQQSYQTLLRERGESHAITQRSARLLAKLYEQWGRPEEAAPWRERGGAPASAPSDAE